MSKKIKILVVVLILIALGFGVYSFVRYETKVYRTIVLQNTKIAIMQDFLSFTFPEQVKTYGEAVKAKQEGKAPVVAPLPTNETKK